MSDIVQNVIDNLINDDNFQGKVNNLIDEIMKDHKIDFSDTPKIILLVVETYNNTKSIKLKKDQIPRLVKGVTQHILDDKHLIPDDQKDTFANMIQVAVELVMVQPKIKNCFSALPCFK